jgi:hypothetical protein
MEGPSASSRRLTTFLACTAAFFLLGATSSKSDKPSITVKASPTVGFAPARIVLTADVTGGRDDYEEFYCASVEWDMGDGNKSEQKADCEPYEPGKSQIKRQYMKDQIFSMGGEFQVQFRLKQKNKVVGSGRTTVRIQSGIRGN